jgi:hypothetical protein
MANPPSSVAENEANEPDSLPIGVRAPARMTMVTTWRLLEPTDPLVDGQWWWRWEKWMAWSGGWAWASTAAAQVWQ